MHRVLVLSHLFPPAGGGGVVRVHSFVRRLSQYGWEPTVLTVTKDFYPDFLLDESLMKVYGDEVTIVRTHSLELAGMKSGKLQSSMYGAHRTSKLFEIFLKPFLRTIYRSTFIPDDQILWLFHAVKAGINLIKQRNIDIIFATTPPHSVGLIAYFLSRFSKIPFVLDVRDDWVGNPLFDNGWFHRRFLARRLERMVINEATRVVAVTPESVDLFQQKYPNIQDMKFVLIPNGFERKEVGRGAEVPSIKSPEEKSILRIVYTGGLPANRTPANLFVALQSFRNGAMSGIKIRIEFYGYYRDEFQDLIAQMGLDSTVKFHGFVSKSECNQQLALADVALVIIPEQEGSNTAVPGKIYEYMGMGKFILALCPDPSAPARLIREFGLGIVAPPDDPVKIMYALQSLVERYYSQRLHVSPSQEILNQFDRKEHTKELARLFTDVISSESDST